MLPLRLEAIKDRIAAKPLSGRNTEERELLAELNTIDDGSDNLQKALKESFKDMRSFAPTGGVCACCGR
jgi:hypothetical protein